MLSRGTVGCSDGQPGLLLMISLLPGSPALPAQNASMQSRSCVEKQDRNTALSWRAALPQDAEPQLSAPRGAAPLGAAGTLGLLRGSY